MKSDSDWHLDKKVPLGLLVMIVVQTITLVYVGTTWKSDIDHRLVVLEKSDDARSPQGNRLTILEQQFSFIQQTLGRIERKLDATP
jgi:hypothetical protein